MSDVAKEIDAVAQAIWYSSARSMPFRDCVQIAPQVIAELDRCRTVTTISDEDVERGARAICAAEPHGPTYDDYDDSSQNQFKRDARAALESLISTEDHSHDPIDHSRISPESSPSRPNVSSDVESA